MDIIMTYPILYIIFIAAFLGGAAAIGYFFGGIIKKWSYNRKNRVYGKLFHDEETKALFHEYNKKIKKKYK